MISTSDPPDGNEGGDVCSTKPAANYETGYGRPPISRRFKKGRSGNPGGRPRAARNLKTELMDEMTEKIAIREQGVPKKVSKVRAIIKSMVSKAIQGDPRFAKLVLDSGLKLLDDPGAPQAAEEDLSAEDKEIVERFLQRETNNNTGERS